MHTKTKRLGFRFQDLGFNAQKRGERSKGSKLCCFVFQEDEMWWKFAYDWRTSDLNMRREFITVECVDPIELSLFVVPSCRFTCLAVRVDENEPIQSTMHESLKRMKSQVSRGGGDRCDTPCASLSRGGGDRCDTPWASLSRGGGDRCDTSCASSTMLSILLLPLPAIFIFFATDRVLDTCRSGVQAHFSVLVRRC